MIRRIGALLVVLTTSCASHLAIERHAKLAVLDVKTVTTAPLHASSRQWQKAAIAAAAVGATTLADDEVARFMRRHQSNTAGDIFRNAETLGGGNSTKVMAAFLAYGLIRHDDRAFATGFDAWISSLIASSAITPAIKEIAKRKRPNGGTLSFPSNHSTEAFALATTIATHYPERWVQAVSYGLASGVAVGRVYHDAHWTSDVVAGAIIGTAVAKIVVHTNDSERVKWTIVPVQRGMAVSVVVRR